MSFSPALESRSTGTSPGPEIVPGQPASSIEQVIREQAPELMAIPGVVGVSQSLQDSEPCIMIMVAARTSEIDQKIPDRLGGYVVTIRVTGELNAS